MDSAEATGVNSAAIAAALEHAAHVLPDQGPIGVFIHHNTLHAFQHLKFHDAVQKASGLLGTRPYLDLDEFRSAHAAGRIEEQDIQVALRDALGDPPDHDVAFGLSRMRLWRLLLDVDSEFATEIDLARLRRGASPADEARWAAAERIVADGDLCAAPAPSRHRRHAEALRALRAGDPDLAIHDELVRLCAAFLDQGQALSAMPNRSSGFLTAVSSLYSHGLGSPRGCPGVASDFRLIDGRSASGAVDALDVIRDCVVSLGVAADDLDDFILATAAALAGWAGMFGRLERHPDEGSAAAPARLADFMAVRLLLERRAIEQVAREAGLPTLLADLRARVPVAPRGAGLAEAFILVAVASATATTAEVLERTPRPSLQALFREVAAFPDIRRRAVWMEAYERWYYRQVLNGIAALRPHRPARASDGKRPRAQYMFCMDEREESIRRALEEQGAEYETFGLAGFFGVAIDYLGLYDMEPAAHCPVVVTPAHEVHEQPVYTQRDWHDLRDTLRRAWNSARRHTHFQSRTLAGGAGLSLLLAPLYAVYAALRVFKPHSSLGIRDRMAERVAPMPATRLVAVRADATERRSERGKFLGFTLQEAADRVASTLRGIGLTERFAPIVIVLGHGSTSLNNPHESAHDCGACGGRRGGANARLFAELANHAEVRLAVRAQGVQIPADTWFVGGLHDTADDRVDYADLSLLPHPLASAFNDADAALDRARRMSAAERCRRFHAAPLPISPDDGLRHVETRARQLAQPRPEYGHCTNAVAIVGRRSLTRGLHLDRRAFLISYDPTIDPSHSILERILAAAGPVGAGISLEYYFSRVDNERYGCGTKLPHNVVGLIGIMNGHKSDLRTGLPLQMVELHEPMRLLIVAESSPEALLGIASRQAEVRELVVNRWVQLACVDPETGAMHIYTDRGFVPYLPDTRDIESATASAAWHGLRRDHLKPAIIDAALGSVRAHGAATQVEERLGTHV